MLSIARFFGIVFLWRGIRSVPQFKHFRGAGVVGFAVDFGEGGMEGFGDGLEAVVDLPVDVEGQGRAVRKSVPPWFLRVVLGMWRPRAAYSSMNLHCRMELSLIQVMPNTTQRSFHFQLSRYCAAD